MIETVLKIVTSIPFGLFIGLIAVIGRNLTLKADAGYYPKKADTLNEIEKRKLKKMRKHGEFLLWMSTPFLIFYIYCLIVTITNL
jgi:hypothetical protein